MPEWDMDQNPYEYLGLQQGPASTEAEIKKVMKIVPHYAFPKIFAAFF